jgi:dTDP-4-dehydrorhamnose 3,5-epimerase-like enzyme
MPSKIAECTFKELRRIGDRSGSLTPIYPKEDIPFDIQRVFYLYDIPGGASRAAHAHKTNSQFLVSALGSFDVILDDGREKNKITLNRPYMGLYIPPGIWAKLENFSSGAICLVLASELYNPDEYISDYEDFLKFKHSASK